MTLETPNLAGQKAETCDVLVIGGGPGGAAAATLLVQAGLKVVIVEKDKHPRFHIGESLLPHTLPILESLGILDRVREIGLHKPGAEFISEDGEKTVRFHFDRALTDGPDHAYQVIRQDFDKLLFDRAREVGAIALEETVAEIISCDDTEALVQTRPASGDGPGEPRLFRADFLVDASGRSTLTAKMRREREPDPRNTSAAIFGHFHGVPRPNGPEGGNIRIHLTRPGWMWQIPLPNGATSIGLVAPSAHLAKRDCGLEQYFRAHCTKHPEIARMVEHATLAAPMQGTGNFSYRAKNATGPGHIKVGDAYGFIDPIFSTGVHLALNSAKEATRAILQSRKRPKDRARLMTAYDAHIQWRLGYVSWFIYNIHDPAFREMLLNPRDILGIEKAVISLLAGDFRPDLRIRSRIWLFKAFRRLIEYRNAKRGLEHA
ncbi:MAG: NAD(P)/FAD-dependent oxidoreductase [Pseudomonadota bacterium]